MKEFEASVLTFNLDRVKEELARLGLGGVNVSETRSVTAADILDASDAPRSPTDFLPRICVRVVVRDDLADRAEDILRAAT
jgi:nitrogen regulatory protein PII